MKRFYALISILLFAALACSVVSTPLPVSSPTFPAAIAASPTPPPIDESPAPQAFAEDESTSLPAVTESAPPASPQPAVARHHPGDVIVPDRVVMIDALNGWAISGADVLFTADGTRTWREATPPESFPAGTQARAQGAFLDSRHAWIVFSFDNQIPPEAVVWSTKDGGYTWTPGAPLEHQAFGEQVWAEFAASDEAHVWVLVRGVYLGAGTHYAGQLLRSADGSLHWVPSVGNETFDYNYDYTGLVFADPEYGLVTWETIGAYAPSPPAYAVTSDGGVHWDVRELPPPGDSPDLFQTSEYCEPFQPQMFSRTSIRMLVGCFDFYDPPQVFSSYLYSSEDAGATWMITRLPEKVRASQSTLLFFDRDHGLLLGRDIYRSTDGGQNWQYVKSVNWDAQFTFVDPQTGWAVAHADNQTAFVKTSNGGISWIEIKPVIAP
jgi:photosystem II stability/assembly factor-like uncharacterized protein